MVIEKIVVGANTEFPLNGLLTLPEGVTPPRPAVVFVHGSGSSDMNSTVYKVSPFKDMAEGLAKYGIASIRYDKRTWVYPKKFPTNGTVKWETIDDAVLATNILKNDPRIDSQRVFIAGLSMGAMLAPRIDDQGGDYAGLILMAGTTRRLEEVMKDQSQEFLANTSNPLMKWLVKKQIKNLHSKFNNLYDLTDEEAVKIATGGGTTAYYFKDMGIKTVREYLAPKTKPILVMQGDADFHVCVKKDFNDYQDILKNNPNATFRLYPNINHVFMPTIYGRDVSKVKKEYSAPNQKVADFVIKDIADWINSYDQ